MKKENKQEELQSRREFFKSAAKAALPVIGAVVLSALPIKAQASEMGCDWGCTGNCYGGCDGMCGSNACMGSCQNDCYTTCRGTCRGMCTGSNNANW
ncbi:MAG: Cys-Xaa-Xaa-Xaa repeat radical SAM target protein [Paludibacteraceae bacterium]|nr:Cys-Xaa-Xaa-Xaa repeat radical SAM target protein [Paludibacteraceae bacterium]